MSLLDEYSASMLSGVEDDLSTFPGNGDGDGGSVASSIDGIPLGSLSLDGEDEEKTSIGGVRDRMISELTSFQAGAGAREVPVMMANPLQAQVQARGGIEETEIKLLQMLESQAREKIKCEEEKERAALS